MPMSQITPTRILAIMSLAASWVGAQLVLIPPSLAQQPPAAPATAPASPGEPPANPAPPPASPPAAAPANPAPGSPPPSASTGTPAVVLSGEQVESILGKKIRSSRGEDMGRIVDLIVDKSGKIRAAIIDFGGFLGVGTRQIAVDWNSLRFPTDPKSDALTVDLTRDQLKGAPAYKPGEQIVVLGQPRPTPPPTDAAAQAGGAPRQQ